MAQPTKPQDSIVDLLTGARAEPPRMSAEVELPTLFGPPRKDAPPPFIAKELEDMRPGRQVRMVSFTQTYVLWRPWGKCERCMRQIGSGEITLPEIGDYTCPHTQIVDYKDAKDRVLAGDAVKEFEEHFQLHDGTRCVQFSWLEIDPKFKEEMEKKAKETADRVYPPNPEKAFARKEEDASVDSQDQKETPASAD